MLESIYGRPSWAIVASLFCAFAVPAGASGEDPLTITTLPLTAEAVAQEGKDEPVEVETPRATIAIGLVPILDYTWFSQDRESVEQVGVQKDDFDVRSARIMLRGNLLNRRERPWRYLVAFEYRGLDSDPNNDWSFTDVTLTVPAGGLGELSFGKLKETFSYEMVGDAANLPQLERLMSPFFVSRSWGARLNRSLAGERMTLALGAYNDWFAKSLPYQDSGWDFSARLTGLPYVEETGRHFLHLGATWRYVGADDGVLRYRGRPESNVTDNYVDTGDIPASHANHFGAELLWNEGPVSVLGEYDLARVASSANGTLTFDGWYLTGSWVVTGEHRPYDRKVGYARRVLPERRWGAVELIARYGEVDLTDRDLDGGVLEKWFAGVNWWASRRWRISLGYGTALLDKNSLEGATRQTLLRVQWIF